MSDFFSWFKAKFFLVAVAITWGSLILQLLPLQAVVMVICLVTGSQAWKRWNYSIWMVQDQFVNVVLSGHHVTTVSSSIGNMSYTSATAEQMRKVVDFLFRAFAGQKNHCRNAIEVEDVHRYSAMRAFVGLVGYVISYMTFTYVAAGLMGA